MSTVCKAKASANGRTLHGRGGWREGGREGGEGAAYRHVLDKMLLTIGPREPQIPWHYVGLDGMPKPTCIRDRADNILRLLEGVLNSLPPKLFVYLERLFHRARTSLLDPPRQAAREQDRVFEDDAGGFTLRRHGVLLRPIVSGSAHVTRLGE